MKRRTKKILATLIIFCQLFIFIPEKSVYAQNKQSNFSEIEINQTTFPDTNFRTWLLDKKNLNGAGMDGKLTQKEIETVTKIDVSEQNIQDLTGIEYFTSLEYLKCNTNRLTALDVSHNVALQELYCSNNQLTQLDLSNNPDLKRFYCATNFLNSLNIKNCSKLQSLNCEKNRLTQLDLSGNPELIQLYSRHNYLTQLDVSHNLKLKFIETFDNQLTSFDCTMLTDLEFLHIDYNNLTTLDMSKNPNLEGNGFVAANNHLEKLTLPNIPDFEIEASVFYEQNPKEGYENIKWYYDTAFTQEIHDEDILEANGQTIYAKWIPNPYTVYYKANGGTGDMPPKATEYGATFTLDPNTFTKTGYTFTNWNTHSNGINGFSYVDQAEVTNLAGRNPNQSAVYLYAQWEPNTYTISYDANGGTGNMNNTSAIYDQSVKLAANQFSKSGSIFVGWSTTAGDQNQREFFPEQEVKNMTDKQGDVITLYAVWTPDTQLQQVYLNQLSEFFHGYQSTDYYEEDWNKINDSYATAESKIKAAGSEESQMQAALQEAIQSIQAIKNKTQRTEEIVQEWETQHQNIRNQLSAPVQIENITATKKLLEAALQEASLDTLASYSELTDSNSKAEAARSAREILLPTLQQMEIMNTSVLWLEQITDTYNTPLESVKSTDATRYHELWTQYEQLSADAKIYCDNSIVEAIHLRKNLASEKQTALQQLNKYFDSLVLSNYSQENQEKLKELLENAKLDIETTTMIGMAERIFTEAQDNMKKIETLSNVTQEEVSNNTLSSNPPQNSKETTPKTGDKSPITLWFILIVLALIGIICVIIYKYKKKN